MLAKDYRFHGRRSLAHVYRKGKTVRGSLFSVRYIRRPNGCSYRCAVVVSKKVSKSAVTRNRIRRRIYELCRQHLSADAPFDIICSVFSEQVATTSADKLRTEFLQQMSQAGIVKPEAPIRKHAIIDKKEN